MSLDIVDDLEAAEEAVGTLQTYLRPLAEDLHARLHSPAGRPPAWRGGPAVVDFVSCAEEVCVAYRDLLEPFARPSCEDGDCDWDCGDEHRGPPPEEERGVDL